MGIKIKDLPLLERVDGNFKIPVSDLVSAAANGISIEQILEYVKSHGGAYVLPTATKTVKGGVKIGKGLMPDPQDAEKLTIHFSGGLDVSDSKGLFISCAERLMIDDDDNLDLSAAYQAYIQQLESRIEALEAMIHPHTLTITCNPSSVSWEGGSVAITLSDNFDADSFLLTCSDSTLSLTGSGKNWTLTFPARTETSSKSVTLTAKATKGDVIATASRIVTQSGYVQEYVCWIGHGSEVTDVITGSFAIPGNTSMASLRGKHTLTFAAEDAGDRIFIVVPKSFGIDKTQIIYNNAFPLATDVGDDVVIGETTYSVLASNRLDAGTHILTFNQ